MPITAEDRTRDTIDRLLTDAGWMIQSRDEVNISADRGVAIREFPLKIGYGEANYLLYVMVSPAASLKPKKKARRSRATKSKPKSTASASHPS
jgi:type I restriction enzyme R subunit